jgi:hypothetical protein
MDLVPFIQFTFNTGYISRWIVPGLILGIPVLNFFSMGYLSKASRVLALGSIGLPTWQEKYEIWIEGVKLLFIFILYEAVPFFLFSCGFFLTALSSFTAFFGNLIIKASYLALLIFSFFLPFAFATFSEQGDFRKALEFEKVLAAIRETPVPYTAGYVGTLIALYLCKLLIRIPFLVGLALASILAYYILLLATYYFTQLFRKTTLSAEPFETENIEK